MIDDQKVQEAQSMVQALGALTNSTPLVVQQLANAVPVMARNVGEGAARERLHSGLLNVIVSKVDDHIHVQVEATVRGGRSRTGSVCLTG